MFWLKFTFVHVNIYRCLHVSIYRCAIPPHDFSGKSDPPPPTPPPPRSIYLTQNTTACTITSYFYIVMITVLLRVLYIYTPRDWPILTRDHRAWTSPRAAAIYLLLNKSVSTEGSRAIVTGHGPGHWSGTSRVPRFYLGSLLRSTTMSVHRCEMRDET